MEQKKKAPCFAIIDHFVYKNSPKNTTNIDSGRYNNFTWEIFLSFISAVSICTSSDRLIEVENYTNSPLGPKNDHFVVLLKVFRWKKELLEEIVVDEMHI